MMFTISVPSGGVSTFGPLIVKNFGFDQFQTILLNMPFGAVQLVATLGGAWAATALKMKAPVLAFLSLPPIAGCAALLHLPRDKSAKTPLLVAYYLVRPLSAETISATLTRISRYPCTQASVSGYPARKSRKATNRYSTVDIFVVRGKHCGRDQEEGSCSRAR